MSDFRVFKVLAAVLAVAFVVYAETNVPYIDASGAPQTTGDGIDVKVINSSSFNSIYFLSLSSGWYIVSGEINIKDKTISVSGTANVILEDGSSMTVKGTSSGAGIEVSHGNSLTIYAQSVSSDMGKLTATGGNSGGAGIGGTYNSSYGDITINGGTVTAIGTDNNGSAGIGGGGNIGGSCGKITINGGIVKATGSSSVYGGAGIGGGGSSGGGGGGEITINGGTVTATGGNTSSVGNGNGIGNGIGNGGYNYGSVDPGTFTLNGNAVVFASSVSDTVDVESRRNSGILFIGETGPFFYGSNVTISNDATIPAAHTLSISANKELTVASGITLTNDGTITPEDSSTITVNGTVNGNKISGANTLPSVSDKTATTITLGGAADLLAATGQEVEYAASETDSVPADDDGWRTDLVFSELTPNTEYYIFARSKANANFAQGKVSKTSAKTITEPPPTEPPPTEPPPTEPPPTEPPPTEPPPTEPPPTEPPPTEPPPTEPPPTEPPPTEPPPTEPPPQPPATPTLSQSAAINNATHIYNGISLTAKTSTTIEVYNLSGELVNKQTYLAGSHSISLGHLPKGMYIVRASFGSEKQTLRVPVRGQLR